MRWLTVVTTGCEVSGRFALVPLIVFRTRKRLGAAEAGRRRPDQHLDLVSDGDRPCGRTTGPRGSVVSQRMEVLGRLDTIADHWGEVSDILAVRRCANALLARHALGAADAGQFGAALLVQEQLSRRLTYICLDERLAAIAERESLLACTAPRGAQPHPTLGAWRTASSKRPSPFCGRRWRGTLAPARSDRATASCSPVPTGSRVTLHQRVMPAVGSVSQFSRAGQQVPGGVGENEVSAPYQRSRCRHAGTGT